MQMQKPNRYQSKIIFKILDSHKVVYSGNKHRLSHIQCLIPPLQASPTIAANNLVPIMLSFINTSPTPISPLAYIDAVLHKSRTTGICLLHH